MVWCARESADYAPALDGAMQFFNPYGWIHWDPESDTWHTVTGFQLGEAARPPSQTNVPVMGALFVTQATRDRLARLRAIAPGSRPQTQASVPAPMQVDVTLKRD